LNKVPSAAHAEHYAKIISEKAKWREVISLSNDAMREAYGPHGDFDEADICLGKIAAKAAKVAANGKMGQVYHVADVLAEVMSRRVSGEVRREPTGLARLDHVIGGLTYGEKLIVGGKPSMGKSAMLKKLARNLSGGGITTGIISVEEYRAKIVTNLLSGESSVPNNRIEYNTATPEDWNEVEIAAQKIAELPLYLVDSARKLSAIIAMVNVLVSKHGCRAVFVDHLHIIDSESGKYENRNSEMSKISAELKWVWKDLGIIGVEAAQLNRGGGNDRPTLTSLRDSGTLEADADTVILLHREDYYHRTERDYIRDNTLELIVAKNKHGAAATVPLYYNDARYDIRDMPESYEPERDPTEGMYT
jgi:replicative DNA helicase